MIRRLLLATTAAFLATAAQAEWYQASSQHFVVYADDKPENVKAYTTKLERYDQAMKAMRNVPDDRRGPAARVTVFQLGDLADIQKLYGGGSNSVAGFYQPRASGPVAFVPRTSGGSGRPWEIGAERVLLHEYAHHFMYADWPSAIFPLWFSEGFAEYNSTAIFNPDGSVTFGAPPTDRLFGVADQVGMPLSTMLDPGLSKMDGRQTYALYSRGWALTHYLTQSPERRKMLADYITAINAGKPLDQAAKVFGNVNALDFKLLSYVKSPKFASQVVPADRISVGEVAVRRLSPGEAAIMPALIRSQRGVDEKAAKEVVAMARATAASYPNDSAVQNALAEAEYDAENFAGAEAAADRALAAEPKSIHAMLYKGMARQAVAEAAKSTDANQWKEIRRWYIAANRAATEDPQPLILYYRSFKPAAQKPTAGAASGMLYATALAPFDLSLRIESGLILLDQGKSAEAGQQLAQLAYNPHGGKSAEKVRAVLATLDKSGASAARAELQTWVDEQEAKAKEERDKRKAKKA